MAQRFRSLISRKIASVREMFVLLLLTALWYVYLILGARATAAIAEHPTDIIAGAVTAFLYLGFTGPFVVGIYNALAEWQVNAAGRDYDGFLSSLGLLLAVPITTFVVVSSWLVGSASAPLLSQGVLEYPLGAAIVGVPAAVYAFIQVSHDLSVAEQAEANDQTNEGGETPSDLDPTSSTVEANAGQSESDSQNISSDDTQNPDDPQQAFDNDVEALKFDWGSSDIDFSDVGGMRETLNTLSDEVVTPFSALREEADALGVSAPNILLYGPPGTGKTHIAEALAGELGYPYAKLSGADVQSKWVNESSQQINRLFEEGRVVAQQAGGAVIFIDEVDTVLQDRGSTESHVEDDKVVNEFLNHLEATGEHDLLFIGATNRIEHLDDAAIRSGRIDRKFYIGEPDGPARRDILEKQLDQRDHEISQQTISWLAGEMDGWVAAEIEQLVDTMARNALSEGRSQITHEDLFRVVQETDSIEISHADVIQDYSN